MRAPLWSTVFLTTLLAMPAMATVARLVVVGVADVDASTTQLQAIDIDTGTVFEVGVLHHGPGETPNGIVVDDQRLATVSPRDGELRLYDLQTHEERSLATGLMKNQRPVPTTTTKGLALVGVRANGDGDGFDVVAVGLDDDDSGIDVLASTGPRQWAMVLPRAPGKAAPSSPIAILASDDDTTGGFDVVGGTLVARTVLGAGVFRGGVVRADGRLLVEHEGVDGNEGPRQGSLLQLGATAKKRERSADVGVSGLVGLSPVVAGLRAAASTGSKDGTIVVDEGRGFVRWPAARIGVARPQAITANGDVVVVTHVFRGQSLPSELWAATKHGGHALLTPPARTVVTVYGLLEGPR